MGCGQSQFSLIYPKKFKRKDHKNKGKLILNFPVDNVCAESIQILSEGMKNIFLAVVWVIARGKGARTVDVKGFRR